MQEPVIVTQQFHCDVRTLWNAITSHHTMIQWFFNDIPEFKPEKGFTTTFNVENEGRVFPHLWKIIEVFPYKKIVYDWKYKGYEGASIVTFGINEKERGCELKVTHLNTEPYDQSIPEFTQESCRGGWNYFIKENLVKYLDQNTLI